MECCLAAAMAADAVGYPCQKYFRLREGALAESLSRTILWALVGLAFPVLLTGAAADGAERLVEIVYEMDSRPVEPGSFSSGHSVA